MLSPCSDKAHAIISESKSLSGSLENLQLQAQFQHYRSESYANTLQKQFENSIEKTIESQEVLDQQEEQFGSTEMASPFHIIKAKTKKSNSVPTSAPTSPSRRSQSTIKCSTLPRSALGIDHKTEESVAPKKSRAETISNFFKRLSPKLKRSPSKSKEKPWIVIEFSQNDVDGTAADSVSVASDHSFELALRNHEEQQKNSPKRSASEPVNKFSLHSKLMAKKNYSSLLERDSTPQAEKCRQKVQEIQQASRLNFCKYGKSATAEKWSPFKMSPKKMFQEITGKSDKGRYGKMTMKEEDEKIEIQNIDQDMDKMLTSQDISEKLTSQPPTVILSKPKEPLPCSSGGGSDLLIKEKSDSSIILVGDDQLKVEQPGQPRLHRIHQPPRTLNILHKIVVSSPQMEKISSKMASVESIGSCSLDIDATASESSGTAERQVSSTSQHTLNSVTGEISYDSAVDHCPEEHYTTLQVPLAGKQLNSDTEKSEGSHSPQRQPSYVSISCSVSGYTSFSYYNSKAREGMRSRDNSPGRAMYGNSSEVINAGKVKNSDSTTGHVKFSERKLNSVNSASAIALKSVDMSPEKRRNSDTRIQQSSEGVRNDKCMTSEDDTEGYVVNRKSKSLVQQQIERLYGPGALAQGFLIHQASPKNFSSSKNVDGINKNKQSHVSLKSESHNAGDRTFVSTLKPTTLSVPRNNASHMQSNGGEANCISQSRNLVKTSSQDKEMVRLESASCEMKEVPYMNGHTNLRKSNFKDLDEKDGEVIIKDKGIGSSIQSMSDAQGKTGMEKDGHYFLKMLAVEENKIEKLIQQGEKELAVEELSEESAGRFRAAIGKANLLLAQKFQQFRGLCDKNINQHPQEAFPTTSSDLEGFWDMILIQINDIYDLFREINLLQDRQCQKHQVSEIDGAPIKQIGGTTKNINGVKSKRASSKKSSAAISRSVKAEAAAKSREEARKQLAELKRKARSHLSNQALEEQVEIFIPKNKD